MRRDVRGVMEKQVPSRTFFDRARREAERYGEESWVFLRELVQNGRDAGAGRIDFLVSTDGGIETIVCRDDGRGMSAAEVERYLLRLYASNKEAGSDAIGFFGVGFWSVLLFEPEVIRVRTRQGKSACAFEIMCGSLTARKVPWDEAAGWPAVGLTAAGNRGDGVPSDLEPSGTEIILKRSTPTEPPAAPELAETVREKLIHYVGPVRPAAGQKSLEVFCNGEKINRPFEIPQTMGRRFSTRAFDGTLGFGRDPSVRLYKGGILVRDLTSLDEVIPSRPVKMPRAGWGLHPVIDINVDGLKLLMDRRSIFEDPALHEAVRYCERELLVLHRRLLHRLFPLDLKNMIFLSLSNLRRGRGWAQLGVIVLLLAGCLWLSAPVAGERSVAGGEAPDRPATPAAASIVPVRATIDQVFLDWPGAWINPPAADGTAWDFSYAGPDALFFQLRALSRYEPERGLAPEPITTRGEYLQYPRGRSSVRIRLGITGREPLVVLPLPPGYVLAAGSLAGLPPGSPVVWADRFGEPVVRVAGPVRLEYEAVPWRENPPPPAREDDGLTWPGFAGEELRRVRSFTPEDKVLHLAAWVRANFRYTRDPAAANRFRQAPGAWLEKVMATRAGDCDVLNGTLALLLRAAGIPAQLAVGLVGQEGRVQPALHAWTRYHLDGWQTLDVSADSGLSGVAGTTRSGSDPAVESAGAGKTGALPDGPTDMGKLPGRQTLTALNSYLSGPARIIARCALLAAVLTLGLGLTLRVWRRRRPLPLDEPAFLEALLVQHFRHGSDGSWRLSFRPIFPALSGKLLSLFEIERYAERHPLMGSFPGAKLLRHLPSGQVVLDRARETVVRLAPFLPPLLWLEDLEALTDGPLLPAGLGRIEARIRRWDPGFRLHLQPGSAEWREVFLPLRDTAGGCRHVLLGTGHPLRSKPKPDAGADPADWVAAGVKLILEQTSFYMEKREAWLTDLAREAESQHEAQEEPAGE